MAPRIITTKVGDTVDLTTMTRYTTDEEFSGIWARSADTTLVFTESIWSAPFVDHGGPVGGIRTPIQLVFWGSWWQTDAGARRLQFYAQRVQALLASNYFNELVQYRIAEPPVWRGDPLLVLDPAPPDAVGYREASDEVIDMVDNLIDDEILPDPDEGRIGVIVMMPEGFVVTDADGAHYWDYDVDFPFDSDMFWAGWCRYYDPAAGEDVEMAMQTVAHEIVEMLTDPEWDGWHTDKDGDLYPEIADVAVTAAQDAYLSAWVNDVNVQAYWSNRHNACVIPMDTDYAARIVGRIRTESRTYVRIGVFRPAPGDLAACSTDLPECCIEDRDYTWEEWSQGERAELTVDTERYRSPSVAWSIAGTYLPGTGTMQIEVDYEHFDGGREPVSTHGPVTISFNASGRRLSVWTSDPRANFDLEITCVVSESAISGAVVSPMTATARVVVGFVGAVIEVEQAYLDQRSTCLTAMLRRYTQRKVVVERPPWQRREIAFGTALTGVVLPAYARVTQFDAARRATRVAEAARALLGPEEAESFLAGVIADVPALAAALRRQG